ncbi:type II secretion system secretin GspD [Chondromyces crocatus]|uniref:General secretion pathway protein GspD n=1 Tax=Chondromyces crocatus TaxID=52 RepID=A0A0K1E824_CHOCO|nr:type II secretion system secretin GspD [Chondromyces crocatus]AKT36718.1 uncharacterized protein CMC5_008390 [Chondromyces crocatus]
MAMISPERSLRRARLVSTSALALALAAAAPAAQAQPARGNPVLRTPAQRQIERPPAAGVTPRAATPGPAAAAPVAPGNAPGDDDPMASVKQGVQEIEFKPKPGGYRVSFNLEEAELPELVKAISNITGRRFIYGGKLRQIKASVYAPEKVTAAEAYSAFLSILQTNGMTVIPHGRFLKIVETQGVVNDTTPVFGMAAPVPNEDRYVTRLYRLSNVDANEASQVLMKFKSKDGDIAVYTPGNLLIITDTGSNIQRMLQIIEAIDVGGAGEQLWVQPVHYASAADMATKLGDILDPSKAASGGKAGPGAAGSGGGGKSRIIADDRTNSLILTATEPDYMRVLAILKRLDVPQTGEGQIHVLPLQHALCKDISTTLNQILGGSAGSSSSGAMGGRGAGAQRGAANAGPPIPGSAETLFEGQIKVTCDEASNKLVVTSSMRDYAQLRGVIDELDMPRRQVFIEAVIMDVSVDRVKDWGVGYHAGSPFSTVATDDAFIYGGNNPGQSILGVPANLEALALGIRGPEIQGSNNLLGTGVSIPGLGVVLHWLAKNGDSNVLATPHIIATDNEEAKISIGQNIPLQTNIGGAAGGMAGLAGAAGAAGGMGLGGLLGGFGGFAAPRQDVGTTITVTPHINDSDLVRMEISEEISDAGPAVGALGAIPINKRTAETILTVKDQQTVVIGGLVRDAVINADTKIPILGDLPVLGFLFKQSKKTTTKTNLLLILTPYVIRNQDDLRAIFERKMEERQEFIDRYFVFADGKTWEPPRDWGRQNGLVEDIRQSMIKEEERIRLEEESRPRDRMVHSPVEPIGMPSFGAKSADDTSMGGAPAVDEGGGPVPRTPRAPRVRPQRARPQGESVE